MKILRQQLIRILVPGIGVTAFGLTAYSVTATGTRLSSTAIRTNTSAAPTDTPKQATEITVNGAQVPLDTHGNASVSTDSGAKVNISAPTPQASSQKPAKTSITITSGDTGPGSTSNVQDNSTQVRVNGGSSTYSSSYSSTSVYSTGDGLIQIDQSN